MDDPEASPPQSVNQEPQLYKSVSALADALQVTRQTVHAWFKRPGCPPKRDDGMFDAAAWRAFAQQIGSKTEAGRTMDKAGLEAKELEVIIEDREFRLAVKKGEYTRNDQIEAELAPLVQEAKALLRAKFEDALPLLYCADPAVQAEAKRLNRAAVDEICDRLSDPLPCLGGTADDE